MFMPWSAKPPKDDNEYFERMSHAIFQAGLNWKMIENKWSGFKKAFSGFSINKVARYDEEQVKSLMKNKDIVRNEKKIRAAIYNAQEFLKLKKEYGSFRKYIDSFKQDHDRLMEDLQMKFKHLGEYSSRTFLWMSGVKLKPNREEKAWMAKHHKM